ncbi:hypothetical protein FGO68_gene10997 [Halteria grandinella]|uniref:DOMON domain-containing protein n=1 Tax=Halteria grandinella TaxID=5974 RepID=A0A8J8SZE4_HALGN|nr:hypothetical protein FGO68_gene10997 [Halteria grandinella]
MRITLLGITLLLTLASAQHEGHSESTVMTIEHTEDEFLLFSPANSTPIVEMMYHIHYPMPMSMANGTNQEMHWELRVYNYNISTWPANTTNRLFAALSWANASQGNLTDAVYCSVNPTGNQTRDVIQCYDGYLKSTNNRSAVTVDGVGNLMWDTEKSFTNYSSGNKLFNMTAHFTTYFKSNDTTDITITQGDSMPLVVAYGWLQGGTTQKDVVQYSQSLTVPVAPEESGSLISMGKGILSLFALAMMVVTML